MISNAFIKYKIDGKQGNHLLKTALKAKGFTMMPELQESLKSAEPLQVLPGRDLPAHTIKQFPGFFASHAKFPMAHWITQVQTGKQVAFFSLEKKIYLDYFAQERSDQQVIVAFLDADHRWHANWIGALTVNGAPPEERDLFVDKASTLPLNMLLAVTVLGRRVGLSER